MTILFAVLTIFATFAILGVGCRARRELLDREMHEGLVHLGYKWSQDVWLLTEWEDDESPPNKVAGQTTVSPWGAWRVFRHVGGLKGARFALGILYASQLSRMESVIGPLGRIDPTLALNVKALLRGREAPALVEERE